MRSVEADILDRMIEDVQKGNWIKMDLGVACTPEGCAIGLAHKHSGLDVVGVARRYSDDAGVWNMAGLEVLAALSASVSREVKRVFARHVREGDSYERISNDEIVVNQNDRLERPQDVIKWFRRAKEALHVR